MIQVTAAKIRGYGPWTLTLGSDREHRLQMLQASMYAETQRLFSERDCLVFPNRHDEYFVISNGLDEGGHMSIQGRINGKFEVNLEMHAGAGPTPHAADLMINRAKEAGVFMIPVRGGSEEAIIMHMDVDDITSKTRSVSPYGVSAKMLELHLAMSRYFIKRESLPFFMGGDNFMILASADGCDAAQDFVDVIRREMGMEINCGIGRARTGRRAAMLATKSLDTIRDIRDSGSAKPAVLESCC